MLRLVPQHILIMIGDDGAVVVPYRIPGATPFFVGADAKHAAQEIGAYVAGHPRARLTLFADNLAQDYRQETVPRLNMFDRAKLLQRRLKQNFPAARLTASLRLKHMRHKHLMIGLHESNPVFAWADYFSTRLPHIALLPVEGTRLVTKLMPESAAGWSMLISRQKTGGFRQIVTYKNDLVFTRLTPHPPEDTDDDAETIAHDIKASLDYLTRHGLQSPGELSVLFLMAEDIHTSDALTALPLKSINTLSPHAAARKLGLCFAPQLYDIYGDILFAGSYLSSWHPVLPLMLPDMRQNRQTQKTRMWGLRVAATALTAALCLTLWHAGDLAATIYDIGKTTVQLEQTQHSLSQLQASAAPVTEPLGRLRQALERRHIYEQTMPTPWQGLNELAAGLTDKAKIMRLDWKKDAAAPEIFNVTLRVTPAAADRAETVALFTQAAQDIAGAMGDYNVSITKPPYPSLPQESVSASSASLADDPVGEIAIQRKTP